MTGWHIENGWLKSDDSRFMPVKFLDKEILMDPDYHLYVFAEVLEDHSLHLKFGEAFNSTVYDRYKGHTGSTKYERMLCVWKTNKHDKPIHTELRRKARCGRGYLWDDKETINSIESYCIPTIEDYYKFFDDLNGLIEDKPVSKKHRPLFGSIRDLTNDISSNQNANRCILDLCPRWGKTRTVIELLQKSKDVRICILCSYVGTVKTSYREEVSQELDYSNIKFFDPDDYRGDKISLHKEMSYWLKKDSNNKIIYYIALTGAETIDPNGFCFNRRKAPLEKFKKFSSMMVLEEADFGSCCDKQIKKLHSLMKSMKCKSFYGATGTNAVKINKIFDCSSYYKKDYLLDVLPNREEAVGIKWHVLNNSGMLDFGYRPDVMEDFSDMFKQENGTIKGDTYFRNLFRFLFAKSLPEGVSQKYREVAYDSIIDEDAATMVFTPAGHANHVALKKSIEQALGESNTFVQIIDGETDCLTNAEAERTAKEVMKNNRDKKVFFIATVMANRSFSVPEIKNVILLMNDASYVSIMQRTARGLTPWNKEHKMCNIVDFRFNYAPDRPDTSCRAKYLSQLGLDSIDNSIDEHHSTAEVSNVLKGLMENGRLLFDEYFDNGEMPIRVLCDGEVKAMVQSMDYTYAQVLSLQCELDSVRDPKKCDVHEMPALNKLLNSNVKGTKKISNQPKQLQKPNKEDNPEARRCYNDKIQHLYFLVNHMYIFDTFKYNSNILVEEFSKMSDRKKELISERFGIDMDTMSDIVDLLESKGIDTDKLFIREG